MTSAPFEAVVLCCISPPFGRLSTTRRYVTYVLLTRAPLYRGRSPFSCDLHVLGAPLTFVLSQDQTLQLNSGDSGQPPTVAIAKCAGNEEVRPSGSTVFVERLIPYRLPNQLPGSLAAADEPFCKASRHVTYDSVFRDQAEAMPPTTNVVSTHRHARDGTTLSQPLLHPLARYRL